MNVAARLAVSMLRNMRRTVRALGFEPGPVRMADVRASYRALRASVGAASN